MAPGYHPVLSLQGAQVQSLVPWLGKFHFLANSNVVVQSLRPVRLFAAPWSAAYQAPLSPTTSQSWAQIHVHWVGDAI